ncbi:FAD-binding oxidoreductase [Streptomyces hokutonensis]|uniref:FAD-binding oxidoreductase n=1 Tax=Streptomyces hokutonensis TaxID=1306990 RepID=UPI0037F82579
MADTGALLAKVVGPERVLTEDRAPEEYGHDESLAAVARRPQLVVRPVSTAEVSRIVAVAATRHVPVTARGTGTGLSRACVPAADGIVVSFERMSRVRGPPLRRPRRGRW